MSQIAYCQGPKIVIAWARLAFLHPVHDSSSPLHVPPLIDCSMLLLATAETKDSQPRWRVLGMRPWLIGL